MIKLKEYTIMNDEKMDRALHGSITREGKPEGGVGDEATDEAKLAEYDRLGGLIMKGSLKVKMGSFYDFARRSPRKEPDVAFVTDIDGEIVEVTEAEAEAARSLKEKIADIKKKKVRKILREPEEVDGESQPKRVKRMKKESDEE